MGITKRLKNKPHLKISRIGTFFTSNLGEKTPKKLVGVEVGLKTCKTIHQGLYVFMGSVKNSTSRSETRDDEVASSLSSANGMTVNV